MSCQYGSNIRWLNLYLRGTCEHRLVSTAVFGHAWLSQSFPTEDEERVSGSGEDRAHD